jgi:hypothetical protein
MHPVFALLHMCAALPHIHLHVLDLISFFNGCYNLARNLRPLTSRLWKRRRGQKRRRRPKKQQMMLDDSTVLWIIPGKACPTTSPIRAAPSPNGPGSR